MGHKLKVWLRAKPYLVLVQSGGEVLYMAVQLNAMV
jgi:hypothetical protein